MEMLAIGSYEGMSSKKVGDKTYYRVTLLHRSEHGASTEEFNVSPDLVTKFAAIQRMKIVVCRVRGFASLMRSSNSPFISWSVSDVALIDDFSFAEFAYPNNYGGDPGNV